MGNDWRKTLAEGLKESYKHRQIKDECCAICGNWERPLVVQMIRYAQAETREQPEGFMPQSASNGTVRGAFPVCDLCAPPCPKCKLPICTAKVEEYYGHIHKLLHSPDSPVMWVMECVSTAAELVEVTRQAARPCW